MSDHLFWLTKNQFARLKPPLPTDPLHPDGRACPGLRGRQPLLPLLPSRVNVVQGDKGYDRNAVRLQIEAAGAAPNIPPKSNCRTAVHSKSPSSSSADIRSIISPEPKAEQDYWREGRRLFHYLGTIDMNDLTIWAFPLGSF